MAVERRRNSRKALAPSPMMFSSPTQTSPRCGVDCMVDVPNERALPEPDNPITTLNRAGLHVKVDVPQILQHMAVAITQLVFGHAL